MWRWNSTWWRLLQATNNLVHFCEHKTRAFPVQLVGGSSTGHFTHSAPRGPFRTTRTGVESTIPTYLSPFNSTRGSTLSIKWLETRFLNGQMENWYRTIFKLKKLGWYPREHWVLVVMQTVGSVEHTTTTLRCDSLSPILHVLPWGTTVNFTTTVRTFLAEKSCRQTPANRSTMPMPVFLAGNPEWKTVCTGSRPTCRVTRPSRFTATWRTAARLLLVRLAAVWEIFTISGWWKTRTWRCSSHHR